MGKKLISYNYVSLQKYCNDNNIKLIKDYINIKLDKNTKIMSHCLNIECKNISEKGYRQFLKTGSHCLPCYYLKNNITRFDIDYLKKFCNINNVELLKDYTDEINSKTIIEAKCLTTSCEEYVKKSFNSLVSGGCYCNKCTNLLSREKIKQTCLEKYGKECSLQNEEVKEKGKQTCLEKYGKKFYLQTEEKKEKSKKTSLKKYGTEYPSQSVIVKDKIIQTNNEIYGTDHAFQSEIVKDKIKQTCLEKYGVEYSLQSEEIKEKGKQTCLEKYGYVNPSQNLDIKIKNKQTTYLNYGVDNPSQNNVIQNKKKETCLNNYGVEYSLQSEEVRNKGKETCLKKYGVENPMHNAFVSEKSSKNAYKAYDYIFPSGRVERIQGYEKYMLDELLNKDKINEDDIIVKRNEVPECLYNDKNGKKRRYYVDCFIKSQNRCIETKSTWTANKKKDVIFIKQKALKDTGYNCEIWVYNGKGEKIECYF